VNDIAWCGGKDHDHGAVFASGLGPVSTPIDYVAPAQTARLNIEIHIDSNRGNSPGTAGCIGISSVADYRIFVSWLCDTNPRDLSVDWGLGTCPSQ
jgi:lysozyme